jgi:hypothetical protein
MKPDRECKILRAWIESKQTALSFWHNTKNYRSPFRVPIYPPITSSSLAPYQLPSINDYAFFYMEFGHLDGRPKIRIYCEGLMIEYIDPPL